MINFRHGSDLPSAFRAKNRTVYYLIIKKHELYRVHAYSKPVERTNMGSENKGKSLMLVRLTPQVFY